MNDYRILISLVEKTFYREAGVHVKVLKNTPLERDNFKYKKVFDKIAVPFLVTDLGTIDSSITLTEITSPLHLKKFTFDRKDNSNLNLEKNVQKVETSVSRGYYLTLPGLGDIIITHNGNVVINITDRDNPKPQKMKLHIETPQQVCLNTTDAKFLDLDIIATSVALSNECVVVLNSVTFTSNMNNNLANAIFVDTNSKLIITNFHAINSILMVFGELRIYNDVIFEGGQIFNAGKIRIFKSSCQKSNINVSYFFNAENKNVLCDGIFSLNTQILSNLGHITINTGKINVRNEFHNQGFLTFLKTVEIEGEGEFANNGEMLNEKGDVILNIDTFHHLKGEIKLDKFNGNSQLSIIEAPFKCKTATFSNKTINKHSIIVTRDAFISGEFINYGIFDSTESVQFEGDKTIIQNANKMKAGKVVSNSKEAILNPEKDESKNDTVIKGQFEATKLIVNGQFKSNPIISKLDTIEIGTDGEFIIDDSDVNLSLKTIKNGGKLKVASNVSSLEFIESEPSSCLFLESTNKNFKVKSLSKLRGFSDINVNFNSLNELEVPSGAKLNLMSNCFLFLKTLIVQEGAELIIRKGAIQKGSILSIYNFGHIKVNDKLLKVKSIYNGPKAEFLLYEDLIVYGRKIDENDRKLIKIDSFKKEIDESENKIWVINEGIMSIMAKDSDEIKDTIKDNGKTLIISIPNEIENEQLNNSKLKGLKIYNHGKYIASKNALICLDNMSALNVADIINYGKIYCTNKMLIDQISKISRLGKIISGNGIDYNVYNDPLLLNGTFQAIINDQDKRMNINCQSYTEITGIISSFVDMHLNTSHLYCNGILSTKSFFLNSHEFIIMKSERSDKKNTVSANEKLEINTNYFMNDGGVLQCLSSKNPSKIIIKGIFKNTGGGEFTNEHQSIKWYSKDIHGNLKENITTLKDYMYTINLVKTGLITTAGTLIIEAGDFDNSFGIINGGGGLTIISKHRIMNECGMIYSGGKSKIKGDDMDNGFVKSGDSIQGLDLTKPIFQEKNVLSSYINVRQKTSDFSYECWIKRYRKIDVLSGYQTRINYAAASKFRGYIFSEGNLSIELNKPSYLGTIVSGENITFQGKKQLSCNNSDLGNIIAGADVKLYFEKACEKELHIEARNILIEVIKNLTFNGVIAPISDEKGHIFTHIDLAKLSHYLGFTINPTILQPSIKNTIISPLNKYVSIKGNSENGGHYELPIFSTKGTGFIGNKPKTSHFMSIIQNSVLNQLVRLTLTPYFGRDILLHIDIINELKKEGEKISDSATNSQEIVLKNGKAALMFQQIKNQEVEMEIDGEIVQVPICNPYLVIDSFQRLVAKIQAEQMLHFHTKGGIKVTEMNNNIECHDLALESEEKIEIASQFKYRDEPEAFRDGGSGYYYYLENHTKLQKTEMKKEGNLYILGKKGVTTKAANLSAKNILIRSKEGNIVDFSMTADPIYKNRTEIRKTQTTTMQSDSIKLIADKGNIEQESAVLLADDGGILIKANKYKMNPAYEISHYRNTEGERIVSSYTKMPKKGALISKGNITFMTKDSTLMGATIIASGVNCLHDGDLRFLPSYIDQHNHAYESHSNFWGSSSVSFDERRKIPVGCQILANEFNVLGAGTLEMEGVTAKIINATITKKLEERAAYETSHSVTIETASGFSPPKIKGDCFMDACKNASASMTCFEDALPATLNLASEAFQTVKHLKLLMNLSVLNPVTTIAEIFLSRFVTSFSFMNVETTLKTDAKIAHQSNIDIEVLRINNERTHLEGIYNIKKGEIISDEITTKAPESTIHSNAETHGYCISLSPAAIFGACVNPSALAFGACLPTFSVFSSNKETKNKQNLPQIITADDLFIKCKNAVFSGSKIEGRMIEMIVSGDLKYEDIASEFEESSSSKNFSVNLGSVFKAVESISTSSSEESNPCKNGDFYHPGMAAIPHIRYADENKIRKKVQNFASLVGRERFILKVGGVLTRKNALIGLVPPDGVVNEGVESSIEAGKIIDEKIQEIDHHEKHVFNPCLAEFVGVVSSYHDWKETEKYIEKCKHEALLDSGIDEENAKKKAKEQTQKIKKKVGKIKENQLVILLKILEGIGIEPETLFDDDTNVDSSQSSKSQAQTGSTTTSSTKTSSSASSTSKSTPSSKNASSASKDTASSPKASSSASISKDTSSASSAQKSSSKPDDTQKSDDSFNQSKEKIKSQYRDMVKSKFDSLAEEMNIKKDDLKQTVCRAAEENKNRNIEEVIMQFAIDTDDFIVQFQKEHPTISYLLGKLADITDTSFSGANLAELILKVNNPYQAAGVILKEGVKYGIKELAMYLAKKESIEYMKGKTNDKELAHKYEVAINHLFEIFGDAASIAQLRGIKKATTGVLNAAAKKGPLDDGIRKKLFNANLDLEIKEQKLKFPEEIKGKSPLEIALDSFNPQNIPKSHTYNINASAKKGPVDDGNINKLFNANHDLEIKEQNLKLPEEIKVKSPLEIALDSFNPQNIPKSHTYNINAAAKKGPVDDGNRNKPFNANYDLEIKEQNLKLPEEIKVKSPLEISLDSFNPQNIPKLHTYNINAAVPKIEYAIPSSSATLNGNYEIKSNIPGLFGNFHNIGSNLGSQNIHSHTYNSNNVNINNNNNNK